LTNGSFRAARPDGGQSLEATPDGRYWPSVLGHQPIRSQSPLRVAAVQMVSENGKWGTRQANRLVATDIMAMRLMRCLWLCHSGTRCDSRNEVERSESGERTTAMRIRLSRQFEGLSELTESSERVGAFESWTVNPQVPGSRPGLGANLQYVRCARTDGLDCGTLHLAFRSSRPAEAPCSEQRGGTALACEPTGD
jgi:hypothetical protein